MKSVLSFVKRHKFITAVCVIMLVWFAVIMLFSWSGIIQTLHRPNKEQTAFLENYYGFTLADKEYISKVTVHGWQDSGVWVYVKNIKDYEDFMKRTSAEYEFDRDNGEDVRYAGKIYGMSQEQWTFKKEANGKWGGHLAAFYFDEKFWDFYDKNF